MADSRLQWRQVAAPNLTGAAAILAGAGETLDRGLAGAQDVIAQYNTGQQQKADNELLSEIAGIGTEEELGAFLDSGTLDGRNISQEMRNTVLGLRGDVLGYGQTRANTTNTDARTAGLRASTAIAQAAAARDAAEYSDKVNTRDARRGLAGAYGDALTGARNHGYRPNGDGSIASGLIEAADELGIDPIDLATTISYETGGTFDPVKRGPTTQWGQHRGLIQFGEPQAKQYGVNWDDPIGSQLGRNGAIVKYLRGNGVTPGMGLMDIYSTINAGAPGLYDRSDANNGGAPGTVADKVNNQMDGHRRNAIELLSGYYDNRRAVNGVDNFIAQAAATGQYTPAQLQALADPLYTAQNVGQARVDEQAATDRSNTVAAAILGAAGADGNATSAQYLNDVSERLNTGQFTPNQRLAGIERAGGALNNGYVSELLAPTVLPDQITDTAAALTIAANNDALRSSGQTYLVDELSKFSQDPIGTLMNDLGSDVEGLSPNQLRQYVSTVSEQAQVSPEAAALSIRETFNNNPTGPNSLRSWDAFIQVDDAIEHARTNLNNDAIGRYREARANANVNNANITLLQQEYNRLRSQVAKSNGGTPEQQDRLETLRSNIQQYSNQNPAAARGTQTAGEFISQVAAPDMQRGIASMRAALESNRFSADQREQISNTVTSYLDQNGYTAQLQARGSGTPERVALERQIVQQVLQDNTLPRETKALIVAHFISP